MLVFVVNYFLMVNNIPNNEITLVLSLILRYVSLAPWRY